MNASYKLTAYNGAEIEWTNNSFWCNEIFTKEQKDTNNNEKYHYGNKLKNSDKTDVCVFGNSNDFSYGGLKDAIAYNIGIMIDSHPETIQQLLNYFTSYPAISEYD